jgi:pimeloyl-ACP methyl ester carboxylesterase
MQLHFKELGQGLPLVILHGLLGSSDNWLGIAPQLAEKFHVFIPDLRNHGQSPHHAEMNFTAMATDVVEFFAAQNLEDACMLGHSLGGKVVMQFALQHPGRVQKLVVEDMAPRAYAPAHDEIFSALLALDLKAFATRQQIEAALEPQIPDLVLRRFLLKNLGRDVAGGFFWKINLRGIAENYPHLCEALAAGNPFAQPTLFIRGGKSDYIRTEDEPLIRELFPQSEIQTIAGANHWVHGDQPAEFLRLALEFL